MPYWGSGKCARFYSETLDTGNERENHTLPGSHCLPSRSYGLSAYLTLHICPISHLHISTFFDPLKDTVNGSRFQNDEEIQSAIHERLRTRSIPCGTSALVTHWPRCIELHGAGGYVEK